MVAKWTHPTWGMFKHDGTQWEGKVDAPAFRAFTWDVPRRPGAFEFGFESFEEKDVPTAEMIAVAERVLAAQEKLVGKVTKALWDEFNGRGGESGMWWEGGLDQVADSLEDTDLTAPKKAADILPLMRLSAITVRPRVHGYDRPLVELRFYASFEEEHGVGVLTDGRKILGTGYSTDVTPYPSEVIERKSPSRTVKGRLRLGEQTLTGWLELSVEATKGAGPNWGWKGSFPAPAGFQMDKLPRTEGSFRYKLELEDGKAILIFLREQDESGAVTFFCPAAPELPLP